MDKQLTQKDLAQKINEKPSVIQDYESGKAIPSAQILSKMERILSVKLRGMYCSSLPTTSNLISGSRYRRGEEAGGAKEVVI